MDIDIIWYSLFVLDPIPYTCMPQLQWKNCIWTKQHQTTKSKSAMQIQQQNSCLPTSWFHILLCYLYRAAEIQGGWEADELSQSVFWKAAAEWTNAKNSGVCLGTYTGPWKPGVLYIFHSIFLSSTSDCYITSFVVKNNIQLQACVELGAKWLRLFEKY